MLFRSDCFSWPLVRAFRRLCRSLNRRPHPERRSRHQSWRSTAAFSHGSPFERTGAPITRSPVGVPMPRDLRSRVVLSDSFFLSRRMAIQSALRVGVYRHLLLQEHRCKTPQRLRKSRSRSPTRLLAFSPTPPRRPRAAVVRSTRGGTGIKS